MFKRAVKMASYFGNKPKESKKYETRNLRFLVRICYQLQNLTGSDPFYFSWNQVATVLNITFKTAGNYIGMLVSDKIITVVKEHTETNATYYKYTGGSAKK